MAETARERFLRRIQQLTGWAGERMTDEDAGVHTRRHLKRAAPVLAALATLATAGGWSMPGIVELLLGLLPTAVGTVGVVEWLKDLLKGLRVRLADGTDDLPQSVKVVVAFALAMALSAFTGVDIVELLPEGWSLDDGTIVALLSMGVTWVLGRLRGKGKEGPA